MYSDEELISGCLKKERSMQKALYNTYGPKLMVVCLRYADSNFEAEDMLQEALVKAFDKLETFRGDSSLYAWLKRIAINTALNIIRSKVQMTPLVEYEEENSLDDRDLSQLGFQELLKMIQNLPSGCRAVFNLMAIEGYKHEEIAKELNISVGTSKSQYSRARQLLQQQLKTEELRSHG